MNQQPYKQMNNFIRNTKSPKVQPSQQQYQQPIQKQNKTPIKNYSNHTNMVFKPDMRYSQNNQQINSNIPVNQSMNIKIQNPQSNIKNIQSNHKNNSQFTNSNTHFNPNFNNNSNQFTNSNGNLHNNNINLNNNNNNFTNSNLKNNNNNLNSNNIHNLKSVQNPNIHKQNIVQNPNSSKLNSNLNSTQNRNNNFNNNDFNSNQSRNNNLNNFQTFNDLHDINSNHVNNIQNYKIQDDNKIKQTETQYFDSYQDDININVQYESQDSNQIQQQQLQQQIQQIPKIQTPIQQQQTPLKYDDDYNPYQAQNVFKQYLQMNDQQNINQIQKQAQQEIGQAFQSPSFKTHESPYIQKYQDSFIDIDQQVIDLFEQFIQIEQKLESIRNILLYRNLKLSNYLEFNNGVIRIDELDNILKFQYNIQPEYADLALIFNRFGTFDQINQDQLKAMTKPVLFQSNSSKQPDQTLIRQFFNVLLNTQYSLKHAIQKLNKINIPQLFQQISQNNEISFQSFNQNLSQYFNQDDIKILFKVLNPQDQQFITQSQFYNIFYD